VSLLHEADPSAGFLTSSSSSRLLGRKEWACLLRWARAIQGAKWQTLMLGLAADSSGGSGGDGIHQPEHQQLALGQLAASVDQWADEFHVLKDLDAPARRALADVCGVLVHNDGTGNSSSYSGSISSGSTSEQDFATMRAVRNQLRSHLDPRRKYFNLLDVQTCFGFGFLPALPSSATLAGAASSSSPPPWDVNGEGDGNGSSSSRSIAGTCEVVVGVLQVACRGSGKPQLLVEPWSAFPPVLVIAHSSLVCAATVNGLDVLERSLEPENEEEDDGEEEELFEEEDDDEGEKAHGDDGQRVLIQHHSASTR